MVFEINNTDCSGYLADGKYSTDMEPVYALRYTDTDGIEHATILRWKSRLYDVPLKILSATDAAALATILSASSLSIKYTHGSLGVVTQDMILDDSIKRGFLPSNDTTNAWWNGGKLSFTQR